MVSSWKPNGVEITFVAPAYSEEDNIPRLVERIESIDAGSETETFQLVLIVNDSDPSDTPDICDSLAARSSIVTVVHRTGPAGYGNALKEGLEAASGDVIIPLASDLAETPEEAYRFLEALDDGYDFVYDSRFLPGGRLEGYPRRKLLYNRLLNQLVYYLFGTASRDVTNGFSAYRRTVIEGIGVDSLRSEGFDVLIELPLLAHIYGYSSTEVPVSWKRRDSGESKFHPLREGPRYLRCVLRLLIKDKVMSLKRLAR